MRKVLLYIFIGTFYLSPALGVDGGARSGISNENNRVLRSSVPVRNLNGAGVSRAGSSVVMRTATNDKARTTTSRSATTSTRDIGRTNVTRSATPIQKQFGVMTRSSINKQNVAARAAKIPTISAESIAQAKEVLEQTAQLNKSCQEQYNECMDQFCAVVDTNQKRCSCSANLSNYSKVEEAVTSANAQLNEIAQRIRYVGLSADEISAIMSATEAEDALDGQKDTSETRSMLDDIEKLIKDPTSVTSYDSSTNSGFGLDLEIDFSDSGADMFSLDFLSDSSSESSISNKRGTDLYNVAKRRCATVLNECKNAGATSQQITGNYDLAIDKDCIAYEQGLNKMNNTLVSNVRSANLLLQKARLAVLQNKTQYDAKGCIGALETCMTDEMVCGEDYFKCVDPTKKYIDENGNVVLGQNITKITDSMINYEASGVDKSWIEQTGTDGDGHSVADYLLTKIGTGATIRDGGLCRAVLDKCQQYSYKNDKYEPYNDIVVNYIQRAMTNIHAAQSQIISDYASSCMLDVASCYNQQVSQVNAWSSTANAQSIRSVVSGACRNVALTCAYAVLANDSRCNETKQENCINIISEMFYQSLLCPDHSTFVGATSSCSSGLTSGSGGCLNTQCRCYTGYKPSGNSCYKLSAEEQEEQEAQEEQHTDL